MSATLQKAGFKPPQQGHYKPDPRGPEYGYFVAFEPPGGDIIVRRFDGSGDAATFRYEMTMSPDCFKNWAEDCT